MGQDNSDHVDKKLERMIQYDNEERNNNVKWYGAKENWKDIKFLAEYFDIDLTKKVEPVSHKRPVFTEKDFADSPSGIIFKSIKNENNQQNAQFRDDRTPACCDIGENLSFRYYFEWKSVNGAKEIPFFMTVWYRPTNEDAIRAVFDRLTYLNSMGVHQVLRGNRITVSNRYKFGEICFTLQSPEIENNEKRLTFFFIRDGVTFRIERSREYDIDSVEFAKYIDDKYINMSKNF
jgi:hypothetical protein